MMTHWTFISTFSFLRFAFQYLTFTCSIFSARLSHAIAIAISSVRLYVTQDTQLVNSQSDVFYHDYVVQILTARATHSKVSRHWSARSSEVQST